MITVVDHESKVPKMRWIGVLGGFGQWATLDVLSRMFRYASERVPQYGNRGYPPMTVKMCNFAPMNLNPDGSYPDELTPNPALLGAARELGRVCDFLIIPSNTVHLFQKDIEAAAGKPVLSLVVLAAAEVVRRGCKRVGVTAIDITLQKGLFHKQLQALGVETIGLPKELSYRLDEEGIYKIQQGTPAEELEGVGQEAVEYLRNQGADAIILGCTEIPILLGPDVDAPDIINPSQLLAGAAIEKAMMNS